MTDDTQPNKKFTAGVYTNNSIGLKITFPTDWQIQLDQVFGKYKVDIVALGAPISKFLPI